MDNLGRTVVATACVLVSAFVAGTPRTFGARPAKASTMTQTSSASSVSKTECIDGACTALAVADTHCGSTQAKGTGPGNLALASEACSIPDAMPDMLPEIDPWDYEPAWLNGLRKL